MLVMEALAVLFLNSPVGDMLGVEAGVVARGEFEWDSDPEPVTDGEGVRGPLTAGDLERVMEGVKERRVLGLEEAEGLWASLPEPLMADVREEETEALGQREGRGEGEEEREALGLRVMEWVGVTVPLREGLWEGLLERERVPLVEGETLSLGVTLTVRAPLGV